MKFLQILFIILINSNLSFGQDINNLLSGYYTNSAKNSMYTSLHFDGNGHVLVNDAYNAEFFQKNNHVYILIDNNIFILEQTKNQLKGISDWVNKDKFKLDLTNSTSQNNDAFSQYKIDPILLYQYYLENFDDKGNATLNVLLDVDKYQQKMEKLCHNNLTVACGALFGTISLQSLGGIDGILEHKSSVISENPKLIELANKMIDLKDYRGYHLLGSYYLMIGDKDKALDIFGLGADKGDEKSALAILDLEINDLLNE